MSCVESSNVNFPKFLYSGVVKKLHKRSKTRYQKRRLEFYPDRVDYFKIDSDKRSGTIPISGVRVEIRPQDKHHFEFVFDDIKDRQHLRPSTLEFMNIMKSHNIIRELILKKYKEAANYFATGPRMVRDYENADCMGISIMSKIPTEESSSFDDDSKSQSSTSRTSSSKVINTPQQLTLKLTQGTRSFEMKEEEGYMTASSLAQTERQKVFSSQKGTPSLEFSEEDPGYMSFPQLVGLRNQPTPRPSKPAVSERSFAQDTQVNAVKARVCGQTDFIEIDITDLGQTFEEFKFMICHEFDLDKNDIVCIRKLPDACERGDSQLVRTLLKSGQNVNLPNSIDGFTGLHFAVDSGNLETVKILLDENADPNKTGPDGSSPLHWAARTDDRAEVIKSLLQYGADPNLQGKFGRGAIHIAANKGLVKNLRALMAGGGTKTIDINLSDNVSDYAKGDTALHLAAANGHESCVNALIFEYKESPNLWARNGKDRIPLHEACTQGNATIVKELVQKNVSNQGSDGEDLTAVDLFSCTPLQIACLHNRVEVVRYLTQGIIKQLPSFNVLESVNYSTDRQGETALHCAARGGSKVVIDLLIAAGANTDCVSKTGSTPLHVACRSGNIDAATALVECNKEMIGSKDESGKTALMIACSENESPDIAQMLIKHGAKILDQDHGGHTPIFEAVIHNRVNVLEFLMTQIGDTMVENDIDKSQNTPLHRAAEKGFLKCCKILIAKNYKIGIRNKGKGKTPIHLAAAEGRNDALQMMLQSKSQSFGFSDTNGNTPLHDAAERGQSQCCSILLSHGANINKQNSRGVTPLHLAAEAGHRTTVKVLLDAGANFNVSDLNDETPLHYSARAGQEDTARALICKGANLGRVSQYGDTPMLTAIRNNNENIIALLIQADGWRDALKVPGKPKLAQETASRSGTLRTSAIKLDVLSEDITDVKRRNEQLIHRHPLHQLIIHYPAQARAIFDKCTYVDPDNLVSEEKADYWVKFNYGIIDDATDNTLHPFNTMIQHDRIDLLDHPLVSSLITYKWNAIGKGWCYLNVILSVIFVIVISTYALLEIRPGSTEERNLGVLTLLSVCSIILSVARLVLEVFQLISNTRAYVRDPMNYLEVVIFVLTIVFCLSIFQYPDTHPSYFQWEVGCYVVVFAWGNLMMSLKKLPFIGIYVIMIKILVQSFIKVMLPISLFLIPFFLMFYMCLGGNFGTFRQPGYTLVKLLTMFTGEINFDMYFVPPAFDKPNPVIYPYSTYPLYILFLFFCPIILMNLLTGLAILDVAETRKTSKLRRSAERIEQIFLAEKIIAKLPCCTAVPPYPRGKLYPNKVVKYMCCFGDTLYDFRGHHVGEIVSRRRQINGEAELRLKQIQAQVVRIIAALNQLNNKIDINTLQADMDANFEEIQARKSKIVTSEV
ncbi:hypothetical protein ACHWQZ_G005652 [Mnemiopsis leidyi]